MSEFTGLACFASVFLGPEMAILSVGVENVRRDLLVLLPLALALVPALVIVLLAVIVLLRAPAFPSQVGRTITSTNLLLMASSCSGRTKRIQLTFSEY